MRNSLTHLAATLWAAIFSLGALAQQYPSPADRAKERDSRIRLYEAAARELPAGVPNPLDPDGTYGNGMQFTTKAYERAAFRLVLDEANRVARTLSLAETLPISESDVVRAFISPFGDAYVNKRLGNITTRNYTYGVTEGNKFSDLCIARYDDHCLEYQKRYQLPIEQVDTNGAYRLAAQWLVQLQVDVKALERDCAIRVEPSEFWNRTKPGAMLEGKTFVPIYYVYWTSRKVRRMGSVASVELLAPTRAILQLTVDEPEYILRQPLVVTNLAFLLAQTNTPVRTNAPARR
jgi:hypothetical protein